MISGDSEIKSRFMLTTSVYRHCCESSGDGFLKLFVTDEQMKLLIHEEKEVMMDAPADTPLSEQETSLVESAAARDESNTSQTTSVVDPAEDDAASLHSDSPEPEHSSGTLLVIVLIRMLLSCLQHVESVDPLFTNLPVIMDLFARLQEDEKSGLFLDKRFSESILVS